MAAHIFFEDNPKPVATLATLAEAEELRARILRAYAAVHHPSIGPQSYRIEEDPPPVLELVEEPES